jgi:hypothetical protein
MSTQVRNAKIKENAKIIADLEIVLIKMIENARFQITDIYQVKDHIKS